MTDLVKDAGWAPLAFAQDTDMASAQALPSIPSGAEAALVQATGANIYWRADGTAPTASVGIALIAGNDPTLFVGHRLLRAVQVIETSNSSVLNVHYFG